MTQAPFLPEENLTAERMLECLRSHAAAAGPFVRPILLVANRLAGARAGALLVPGQDACGALAATVETPPPNLPLDPWIGDTLAQDGPMWLEADRAATSPLAGWLSPGARGSLLAMPMRHGDRAVALLVLALDEATNVREPLLGEVAALLDVAMGALHEFCRLRDAMTALAGQDLLREAKSRAEVEAGRMREFVSRVSHEIRTPLAGLLGHIQLMQLDRSDPLAESQRRRLEQVELAAHRLMELVNSVLDLSRIEHEKESLVLEPVDLNAAIEETLTLLAPLADAHGVRFDFETAELSAVARAERRAVLQVLNNLISNAIKFNRPGGTVSVAVHRRPGRLRLAVSDEGAGLSSTEIEQLFTPFKRFQRPGKGTEGTGLGLTIARRLTEAMGGTIQVWSHPGDGATFEVELTRIDEAGGDPVSGRPGGTASGPARSQGGRAVPTARILYVEDDRLNAAVFSAACERYPQWEVQIAGSVAEARILLGRDAPDLLVTDLELPDGNGFDVLRLARGHRDMRNRCVVALSATTAQEQISRALDAGFDDYWTKPIDVATMLERIRRILAPESA